MTSSKRRFITIDCETDPFKYLRLPEPFLWGTYDGQMFRHFAYTQDMVEWLQDQDVIAFAHNGGKFDFHYLLPYFNTWDRMKIINGRIASVKLGDCELRDSYLLFHEPLEAFKKTKIDYAIFEREERAKPKNAEQILSYLADDCVFLHELISISEEINGRHLTLASACMAQWEKISGQKAPQSSREFFDKFYDFYFGGRVECFRDGYIEMQGEVTDIISAYASAMLSPHAYSLEYSELAGSRKFKDTDFVEVEAISNGCLPWRNEKGVMKFPRDMVKRTYYCTGHELRAGLETHTVEVKKYLKIYRFAGLKDFTPYIMHEWEQRALAKMSQNQGKQLVHKRRMNGLYGKFAACPDNYANFICIHPDEQRNAEEEGYTYAGMLGPYVLMSTKLDEQEERFYNVATSASITGQVRAKLWRAICASDYPIYCDTDCIFARRSVVKLGNQLGEWEREGTFERAWIVGKKMYLLEGDFGKDKTTGKPKLTKQASKGARLTPKQIKRAAIGETVTYEPEAPTFSILRPAGSDLKKTFQARKIRRTGQATLTS